MDDDALMRRVVSGDARAFQRIVQAHQERLIRFAARLLGDHDAACDAAQEAFVRLWRMRDRYQERQKLTHLLLRITRRVCLDVHRSNPLWETWGERDSADAQPGPEHVVERWGLGEAAREAILALPDAQREVFVLSHYERLTYAEIAEVVGCPPGTVASRKRLALETLRRRLAGWEENRRDV